MKRTGKIIMQYNGPSVVLDMADEEELFTRAILKVEQYINDEIASKVYDKFGVLIRVHI